MKSARTIIFIPTFNERENVESLYSQIRSLGLSLDILFLDDNSPDGTGDVLDGLAAKDPNLNVIHRKEKLGVGSAHLEGIRYAYDRGYDRLITMDCDFTHSPSDIPRLMAAVENYDLAVGSRYLREDSLPGWSAIRRFVTRFAHLLTKNLLGLSADASGAFRIYNLRSIRPELFGAVKSRSYSFFFESLFVLSTNGCSINEIPIVLPARTYGHSKMTLREAWRSFGFLLRLWVERLVNPGRFRAGRKIDSLLPEPDDPQNWDLYWRRKQELTTFAYEVIAAIYRRAVIKGNLKRVLEKTFAPSARLLHAGCGSGQVDTDLHERFRITAVDVSKEALDLYSRNNPAVHRIDHASAFALPYPESSFDGVYNLGVVEHFPRDEIVRMLSECRRVIRPGGRVVIFWPHRLATSVMVLKGAHFVLRTLRKADQQLHPPEVSLLRGKQQAREFFREAGLKWYSYAFGVRDGFVQAVVIGEKPSESPCSRPNGAPEKTLRLTVPSTGPS